MALFRRMAPLKCNYFNWICRSLSLAGTSTFQDFTLSWIIDVISTQLVPLAYPPSPPLYFLGCRDGVEPGTYYLEVASVDYLFPKVLTSSSCSSSSSYFSCFSSSLHRLMPFLSLKNGSSTLLRCQKRAKSRPPSRPSIIPANLPLPPVTLWRLAPSLPVTLSW